MSVPFENPPDSPRTEPQAMSQWLGGLRITAVPPTYVELRYSLHVFLICRRTRQRAEARRIFRQISMRMLGRAPLPREEAYFPLFIANLLRQLLASHMRARTVTGEGNGSTSAPTITDIDAALTLLESRDPVSTRIIELRYFAGLDLPDIGVILKLDSAEVGRRLRAARAWLAVHVAHFPARRDAG